MFDRTRRLIRPAALSILGTLPVQRTLSGLGHILMFHRVVSPSEVSPYGMSAFEITPNNLEYVLEFFRKRSYRVVSLDEIIRMYSTGEFETKFIALTFDDGYKDTLSAAYPILKKHKAPFAVYITTNYLDRMAIKWDYLAEKVIRDNDTIVIDTPECTTKLDCSTPLLKRHSCDILQNILFDLNTPELFVCQEEFFASYGVDPRSETDELMLDWEQLEHLSDDPSVTIGCHSLNHYVLSRLSTAMARVEIERSKRRLEEMLETEIVHFSYPFGRAHEAGEREFKMVHRAGFRMATTGVKGNLFPEHSGRLMHLPRFCLGSNCSPLFLSGIANGFLPLVANRFKRVS